MQIHNRRFILTTVVTQIKIPTHGNHFDTFCMRHWTDRLYTYCDRDSYEAKQTSIRQLQERAFDQCTSHRRSS